jgi:hypothetical protein
MNLPEASCRVSKLFDFIPSPSRQGEVIWGGPVTSYRELSS